jgi:flagellar M-ring protein FliF
MALRDQFERLGNSLLGLGARRLTALAIVGVGVFAAVAVGSIYLSRPQYETLYVGLSQQDASRIGGALRDAGIAFDISPDGTKIMVPYGQTARARMLLAEKGLPTSASSGYELFDKLGPVGLTSFMQDVTRVRALEGEISRSVQTMRGIKAARVHIVLPDVGSFRRARQQPTASVIIASEGSGERPPAAAIQHLVAAAVPGLSVDQVTVLSTDGQVLAAGGEGADSGPGKMVDLEKAITSELQENIRKTLIPYLGMNNFEVSVAAKLNTDKRQTNETIYDPESRTERSVRALKETSRSENDAGNSATTVDQNVPGEQVGGAASDRSKSSRDKKEDLTNYELSSKVVSTISTGYRVENLTVAVVVNRKQLMSTLGANATPEAVERQLKELQQVIETSVGADAKRGDRVSVTALDFSESAAFPPLPEPGFVDLLMRQAGSFVNAAAIVIAAFLLVWFGLRPAVQTILESAPLQPVTAEAGAGGPVALEGGVPTQPAIPAPARPEQAPAPPVAELTMQTPQARLEPLVDNYETEAAAVLKAWMKAS